MISVIIVVFIAWMICWYDISSYFIHPFKRTPEGLFLNENKLATWRSIGALATYALLELKVGGWEDEGKPPIKNSKVLLGGGGQKPEESEHFRNKLHKDFKYWEKELVQGLWFCVGLLDIGRQVQRIPLTDSGSPLASPMLLRQATGVNRRWTFGNSLLNRNRHFIRTICFETIIMIIMRQIDQRTIEIDDADD